MTHGDRARWFHDHMVELGAARKAGDATQVELILEAIEAVDPQMRRMATQVIAAAEATESGDPGPHSVGLAAPGELLCDFCAAPNPAWYYPMHEFALESLGTTWLSGDRMYCCEDCFPLVEVNDWRGLRDRVGPAARSLPTRLLWVGFANNRTGGPVSAKEG